MSQAVVELTKAQLAALQAQAADEDRETRGEVCGRSAEARWRLIQTFADYQTAFAPPSVCIFLTLTHAADFPDWRKSKDQFKTWRNSMRYWLGRRAIDWAGLYVPETQRRGAPHYHALVRIFGDMDLLDELAGADRSKWDKANAGRDAGWIGRKWLEITGDEGSRPQDRERYGVVVEDVDDHPDRVGRYLVKRLGNELVKRQQMPRDQREWTGRTWGYLNKPLLEPYYQKPVVTETPFAERRLWNMNEIAQRVLGIQLGRVEFEDETTGEVRAYAPQRTRWTMDAGEYLRTGDRAYLYRLVESKRLCWQIDVILDGVGEHVPPPELLPSRSPSHAGGGVQVQPVGADPPPPEAEREVLCCSKCGRESYGLARGLCVFHDGTVPGGDAPEAPARRASRRREAQPVLFGPEVFGDWQ